MRTFKDYYTDTEYRPGSRFVKGLESDKHVGKLYPKTASEVGEDFGTLAIKALGPEGWGGLMASPDGPWWGPGGAKDRLEWELDRKEEIAKEADWRAFMNNKEKNSGDVFANNMRSLAYLSGMFS